MDFQQAEKRFRQLKAQFETGSLSEPEFKAQLEELMVQDEQGNWWMIGYETEHWYRHDGTNWVQADPPGNFSQKPTSVVTTEPETMERISTENIAREKAGQEATEKVTREKAEREAAEKAATEKPEYEVAAKAVKEKAEREAAEKPADVSKQNMEKLVTDKGFLLSRPGRMLLGGILGLILGFLYIGSAYYSSGVEVVIFVVACGLAGLITFPHKLSIVFLILGFFIAGFLTDPYLSSTGDFIAAGGVFGIPAGALLSRILHWIKVLK